MDATGTGARGCADPLLDRIHEAERELRDRLERIRFCLDGVESVEPRDRARYYGMLLALRYGLRPLRALHAEEARARQRAAASTPRTAGVDTGVEGG